MRGKNKPDNPERWLDSRRHPCHADTLVFLMNFPMLIGSDWRYSAATVGLYNPYDGSSSGHLCLADAADLEAAITSAHTTFQTITRHQSGAQRSVLLANVVTGLAARRAELVDLLIQEAGKPRQFAEIEVTRAMAVFQLAAELARESRGHLLSAAGLPAGAQHYGHAERFPLGVIYAITPFNFPLNLVAHKIAPALATGNTVLLKPSPKTPIIALKLGEILRAAGMPPGQVNIIHCDNTLAARPLDDDRIKFLSFTGSAAIGWQLKAQCRRQKVALELGGNAAAVLHDDADLAYAIRVLATGAFSHAGQSCISTQRIFVHSSRYAQFRSDFLSYVQNQIAWGDPNDPQVVTGPMIDAAAMQRTQNHLQDAVAAGATILCGGTPVGTVLPPTVLEVHSPDLPICHEELFAPVVTLQAYDDFDEALRWVNNTRYGLQASVFTQHIGRIRQAFRTLDVGAVLINQAPTFRLDNQPYGGTKDSGLGREGVSYTMDEMTELKCLILRED